MSSASPTLTPEQTLIWIQAAGSVVHGNVARQAAQTLFYGLFLGMFTYSSVLLLKRRSTTMFLISILTFALETLAWASFFAVSLDQVRIYFVQDPEVPLLVRGREDLKHSHVAYVLSQWGGFLLPVVTDGTVIFRAYALYQGDSRKKLLVIPVLCLIGSTACIMAHLIPLCRFATWRQFILNEDMASLQWVIHIRQASFILSLSTNLLTTGLVAYKLWDHFKFMKEMGTPLSQRGAQRILVLMIESGLVYSAFQAAFLGLLLNGEVPSNGSGSESTDKFMGSLFMILYTPISAMYPLAVIILVQLQLSFADSPSLNSSVLRRHSMRTSQLGQMDFATNLNAPIVSSVEGSEVTMMRETKGEESYKAGHEVV